MQRSAPKIKPLMLQLRLNQSATTRPYRVFSLACMGRSTLVALCLDVHFHYSLTAGGIAVHSLSVQISERL